MLEAGMERARAHLERVQANDDAQIAKSDLDQVLSLDQSLAGMKKKAADDKADFKAATAQIKASHAEIAVLKQHAAKVAKQIKALRGTAAALVAKATHTREEEARAKDKADVAREQLSSALVHRARRRAAVCSPLVYPSRCERLLSPAVDSCSRSGTRQLQKGRAQLVKLQKSA
jgi:septal ring factor EnvC (AmiA/AmiB activator)